MPKIVKMKKSDFLKKVKEHVVKKKESPTKLPIVPASLSVVAIKFVFAKTDEVTLKPEELSFSKKSLGVTSKAKPTDSDASKTYYFSFCAPLLRKLADSRIYVGKTDRERLEALETYLKGVRDDKVIFEIISKADLNTMEAAITSEEGGERKRISFAEDSVSYSESMVEDAHVEDTRLENAEPESIRGIKGDEAAPYALLKDYGKRIEEQEFTIKGLEGKIETYKKLAEQRRLKLKEGKRTIKESSLEIGRLKESVQELYEENQQLKAQHDEGAAAVPAEEEGQSVDSPVRQYTLKFMGESPPNLDESIMTTPDMLALFCEGEKLYCKIYGYEREALEVTVDEDAREASEKGLAPSVFDKILKMTKDGINLEASDTVPQQEDDRLPESLTEQEKEALFKFLALRGYKASDPNEDIEYGGELNDLMAEIDNQAIETATHLSEIITQWANMMAWSRNEPVTIQVYDADNRGSDEKTLPRYLAIAMLEREKAIHQATSNTLWPREEDLSNLQSGGYGFDLKCFSLYQQFPKELKQFAILFAFWEMMHHNRFYRDALRIVLNGGQAPDSLGMAADADPTEVLLKLLHYADAARILMGHYGYIAQKQFEADLSVTQDENKARFKDVEREQVDINRTTAEEALFI